MHLISISSFKIWNQIFTLILGYFKPALNNPAHPEVWLLNYHLSSKEKKKLI